MKLRLLILVICILSFGCKSTASLTEVNHLKDTVAKKEFTVTFENAMPLTLANTRGLQNLLPIGSSLANINLVSTPNFFTVLHDNLNIDIPYFGERQIAGNYNSNDVGIKFKGKAQEMKSKFDDDKNIYILTFWFATNNERIKAILSLYTSNKSTLSINSSHRTTITYNGSWKPITVLEQK